MYRHQTHEKIPTVRDCNTTSTLAAYAVHCRRQYPTSDHLRSQRSLVVVRVTWRGLTWVTCRYSLICAPVDIEACRRIRRTNCCKHMLFENQQKEMCGTRTGDLRHASSGVNCCVFALHNTKRYSIFVSRPVGPSEVRYHGVQHSRQASDVNNDRRLAMAVHLGYKNT